MVGLEDDLSCLGNLSTSHFSKHLFLPPANEVWGKVIFSGSRHPMEADTPQKQTPHGSRHPPRSRHPPGADTPPEADSSIRSTSGRYAYYWNAFLLVLLSLILSFLSTQRQHDSFTCRQIFISQLYLYFLCNLPPRNSSEDS